MLSRLLEHFFVVEVDWEGNHKLFWWPDKRGSFSVFAISLNIFVTGVPL